MKKIVTILMFAIISLSAADVYSKAVKREYFILAALGWDQSFANQGRAPFLWELSSPIIYLDGIYYFGDTGWYGQLGATTVTFYTQWGYNTDLLHVGIKPIYNHSNVGAEHLYYEGFEEPTRTIGGVFSGGQTFGVELFYEFDYFKGLLSGRVMYKPGFHWYVVTDPQIPVQPGHEDYASAAHWEHTVEYFLQSGQLESRELDVIRHGWFIKFRHNYTNRTSYSLIVNENLNLPGSYIQMDPNTHKFFLDLGLYYNFKGDYNLKFEAKGHYAVNVDINNAEKIGSLSVDHADFPGLYYMEFISDKYVMANLKFGIPLPFWGFRLQPGFNMLYIPLDNKVIVPPYQFSDYAPVTSNGIIRYPYNEITYSASLNIYLKLANILPVFIDYAYAFNAVRKNPVNSSDIQYGGHELRIVFVAAFIEVNPKDNTVKDDKTTKDEEKKIK